MRKLGLLLTCVCLSVAGCGGGGMSEAQMRARSRARSPDELESALASTAAPAAGGAPAVAVAAADSTAAVPKAAAHGKSADIPVPPDPPTEAGAVVVVVQNEPPKEPLTTLEKQFRTVENMRRIGQALNAYVIEHQVLPAQALRTEKGKPTLSWRVAILPQLGYESLYTQFRLHEPWDSPHNRQLIAQIPPELQSPQRFDSSTTYLATIAPGSVFGQARGLSPQSFDDGPENTVLLVEVLDELAIAWTQPADLNIGTGSIPAGSARQHPEGTLVLLADGSVKVAPGETPATVLRGLVTPSGDERILAAYVLKDPPRPPRPRILPVRTAASGTPASGAPGSVLPTPPTEEPAAAAIPTIDLTKLPVPDEESLTHARRGIADPRAIGPQGVVRPGSRGRAQTRSAGRARPHAAAGSRAGADRPSRIFRDLADRTRPRGFARRCGPCLAGDRFARRQVPGRCAGDAAADAR